jgi:bacillopeptidase F
MPNYPYSTGGSRSRKTARVSSRLAQAEKKKVVRQTITLSVVGVILLLGFIFVILPGVIRFALNFSDTNFSFEPSDTIPPQVPIISAPAAATSEPTIEVTGFGEPNSQVIFVINGQEAEQVSVAEDGSFSQEVSLDEGENSLKAYSIDQADNESGNSTTYTVIFDNTPPSITLTHPENGQEFVSKANQSISVEGTTEPGARVFVNGRRHQADSEGAFKATIRLNEGDNTISLKAEDAAGQTDELEITVKFKE